MAGEVPAPKGKYTEFNTYSRLLQACITHKTLAEGKQIHAVIIKTGFQLGLFLGNCLIHMYAKCGNAADARQVIDRMPELNAFSWNTVIQGYVKCGNIESARHVFDKMPTKNEFSWNMIIEGYVKCGNLEIARHLFDEMSRRNVFACNRMIEGYVKFGSMKDARQVFDEMPQRDEISWNAMIAGCVRHGNAVEALKLFLQMQRSGAKQDGYVLASVVSACAGAEALEQGKQVHGHIIITGVESDVFLGSALVDMYAKCGSVDDAREVFDHIPKPDAFSWTAMISGYASCGYMKDAHQVFDEMPEQNVASWNAMIAGYMQNGYAKEALEVFRQMRRAGLRADRITFATVASTCASVAALEQGVQVHAYVSRTRFVLDVMVGSALIDMYAKCGNVECACQLFDEMPERDRVAFNAMITVYASCGRIDDARRVFEELTEPNVVSWNAMIVAYSQNGHTVDALELFCQMHTVDAKMDQITMASVLSSCASGAFLEQGKQVHTHITRTGLELDIVIGSALVDMYAKCGSIDDARRIFDGMHEQDLVLWNALITGYAQNGYGKEALQMFEQMLQAGMHPNEITFVGVLSACTHVGSVDEGSRYFYSMSQDHCVTPTAEHYACMVDLLSRAGWLNEAVYFMESMPFVPDAMMWGSLLSACRIHGNMVLGKRAAECLFKLEPQNSAAYILLANMYAAADRWDDVAAVRKLMDEKGVKKKAGCSWILVNKMVHTFIAGDR